MSLTTYPISLPATPGIVTNTIKKLSVVAVASSPFSLGAQSQTWPGQMWASDLVLPKMIKANGEAWAAAFASLNGKEGSLLIGDTANKVIRGTGLAAPIISPTVLNGGFETAGGGGADVFANWAEATAGTTTITRDTSVFSGGAASCRINVDNVSGFASVSQAVLVLGKRYRVSFSCKASVSGTPGFVSLGGAGLVFMPSVTTSFATYTNDFTADGSTLYFFGNGPGATVWFDGITITPLDGYGVLVNGGSQTGYALNTKGWTISSSGVLKAGDWVQLGTGNTARLYKNIFDVNSDGSGNATLTLWPQLRSSPADGAAINFSTAQGRFMLAKEPEYSIGPDHIYSFSDISLMEDLRP